MNEIEVLNLVLGIIGTITGIVALSVHFLRLRRENPRLKIEVLKCEHDFEEEKKTLSFWAELQIRNLGDRGTDILGVDLTFEDDEQEHNLRMEHHGELYEDDLKRWIHPHQTIEKSLTTFTKYEGDIKERINCTLTIYHTHGAEKAKVISERRK